MSNSSNTAAVEAEAAPPAAAAATATTKTLGTRIAAASFRRWVALDVPVDFQLVCGSPQTANIAEIEIKFADAPTDERLQIWFIDPDNCPVGWDTATGTQLQPEMQPLLAYVPLPKEFGYGVRDKTLKIWTFSDKDASQSELSISIPPAEAAAAPEYYTLLLWLGIGVATLVAAKLTGLRWLRYVSLVPFGIAAYDAYKLLL